MTKLRISLAQIDVKIGNPRINWNRAQEVITEAARQKSHIVLLPELWDIGYQLDKAKDFASSLSGGLFSQVSALSTQHKIFILGSMMEKRGLGVSNTSAIFSPNRGVLGAYRKIHLFPLMQEDQWLTPGEAVSVFDMPWGTTGVAICYDLRFPELFRRYAADGAKIVFVPAQWPTARIEHFRNLIRARAIENQMYIVATNRVGEDPAQGEDRPAQRYGGYSAIIDPNGDTVVELGYGEAQVMAEIDMTFVDKLRQFMPVLNDRRTEFYGF